MLKTVTHGLMPDIDLIESFPEYGQHQCLSFNTGLDRFTLDN